MKNRCFLLVLFFNDGLILLLHLLILLILEEHLLDVTLYLRGKELGQPKVETVLACKVPRQEVGVVAFEHLDVLLLAVANVDRDR
jgi:hypothetical protein